jgi:hypothetical protein
MKLFVTSWEYIAFYLGFLAGAIASIIVTLFSVLIAARGW